MTTTAQRPANSSRRGGRNPILTRAAAAGCGTLLVSAMLTGPAAATTTGAAAGTESPDPAGSAAPTAASTPSTGANQAPQLTCGGVMTQAGTTESVRVSVTDPDGDPVTLTADVSMFGVQPAVSGHVITYPAPSAMTGQDNFVVRASDGLGGEATCEIGVLVQASQASPTPTAPPTPTPTPDPSSPPVTPDPSAPAPEPSSEAPTPAPDPEPTHEAPAPGDVPAPAPSSPPAPTAPTAAPVTPGGGSQDETGTSPGAATPAPGTGRDEDSGAAAPGGTAGGPDAGATGGQAGGSGRGAEVPDRDALGPETGAAQSPDGGPVIALPRRPDPGADALPPWAGVIPLELGAGSSRSLSDAQELLRGLDSGRAAPGSGRPQTGPSAGTVDGAPPAAEQARDAEAVRAPAERTAVTGGTGWLFATVGVLMIALVGLALMALPRGRRRH